MHRTKKITVVTTGLALLMAGAGMSSAMAHHDPDHGKVTICHVTGSESNRYVRINTSRNAIPAHSKHEHVDDEGVVHKDIIDPEGACPGDPGGPVDPGGGNGGCVALNDSSNYSSQRGILNVGNVNLHLGNLLAQPLCQANIVPNPAIALLGEAYSGGDHSGSADGCLTENNSSDTFEQDGWINVGNIDVDAGNLLSQPLCQANIVPNPAIALLGEAYSGGDSSDSADGCTTVNSSSDSFEQDGWINVGNIDVDAGNLLSQPLCQANIVPNPAIALLGFGGSSLGSELLSGGPLGLLSGASGYLLSGLTTDVQVLAKVLVQY